MAQGKAHDVIDVALNGGDWVPPQLADVRLDASFKSSAHTIEYLCRVVAAEDKANLDQDCVPIWGCGIQTCSLGVVFDLVKGLTDIILEYRDVLYGYARSPRQLDDLGEEVGDDWARRCAPSDVGGVLRPR